MTVRGRKVWIERVWSWRDAWIGIRYRMRESLGFGGAPRRHHAFQVGGPFLFVRVVVTTGAAARATSVAAAEVPRHPGGTPLDRGDG